VEANEIVFGADEKEQVSSLGESAGEAIESSGGDPKAVEESDKFMVGGVDVTDFNTEYAKTGKLSEESYTKLEAQGFPKQLVDSYIKGMTAQAQGLAEADVQEVLKVAGGQEKYDAAIKWAGANMSAEEKEAFNTAVQTNKHTAKLAVQAVVAQYEAEYGKAPKLLGGGAASSSTGGEVFANRSEMKAAMSDKRYGRDPEYTRSVERKVIASNLVKTS
jgi:hypothetical protein